MKTISIIAEFNPFHNGHLHLIQKCKENLNADYYIVVMSGDFDKEALLPSWINSPEPKSPCNAEQIQLSSSPSVTAQETQNFIGSAVSILNSLGVVDNLCFGSECDNIDALKEAASILNEEPAAFKEALSDNLKNGQSFPLSRQKALSGLLTCDSDFLSMPNNILPVEYIRALLSWKSSIY